MKGLRYSSTIQSSFKGISIHIFIKYVYFEFLKGEERRSKQQQERNHHCLSYFSEYLTLGNPGKLEALPGSLQRVLG